MAMSEKKLREIFMENIRKHRIKNDWSQIALAKKTGVSVNFINDLESGKKWASPATMVRMANAFGIYAYELLKPPSLLPDNLNSIIREYTDTIHAVLKTTHSAFMKEHS
jgi:transcriptional regulator with XRE-family HTH domain